MDFIAHENFLPTNISRLLYIHMYIHTHMHTYKHAYAHMYIHCHTCTHVYIHMYVRTYINLYICIRAEANTRFVHLLFYLLGYTSFRMPREYSDIQ